MNPSSDAADLPVRRDEVVVNRVSVTEALPSSRSLSGAWVQGFVIASSIAAKAVATV